MFLYLLLFSTLSSVISTNSRTSMRVIGWFNGNINDVPNIPWDKYTHIVTGFPTQYPNGTIACNHNDTLTQQIITLANKHNRVVQWKNVFPVNQIFSTEGDYVENVYNYFNSAGHALEDCGLHGIEFDYEWGYELLDKLGIVLPKYSNRFTQFLSDLKSAIPDKIVSADVGVWGFSSGYPLGVLPWVNSTILNNGGFDFINTMSYHTNMRGDIRDWEMDRLVFEDLWGFNLSRVNLGVGYFSTIYENFKIQSEPIWAHISVACPNIDENINVCNNTLFVGKNMNYKIGQLASDAGFGGVFPWTINYDSFMNNNTLINYLYSGLTSD